MAQNSPDEDDFLGNNLPQNQLGDVNLLINALQGDSFLDELQLEDNVEDNNLADEREQSANLEIDQIGRRQVEELTGGLSSETGKEFAP